jgi:hypothetical protein
MPHTSTSALTLTVCSANLRNANADDGADGWEFRQAGLAELLRSQHAHLIGVQEAMQTQVDWLRDTCHDHTIVLGLPYGNVPPYEYAAIAWHQTTFTAHTQGACYLSTTPDRHSRSWDTSWTRVANWVVLHHHASQQTICYVNTHLDHMGAESRRRSIDVIIDQLAHLQHLPIIISADFNAAPDSDVHAALREHGFIDSWQACGHADGPGVMSFHGFHGDDWPRLSGERNDNRIDWICYRDPVGCLTPQHSIMLTNRLDSGRFPSDHYPITTTFTLTPREIHRGGTPR